MSSTNVRRGVEQNGAGASCLIEILTQLGWRVFIIRRRLSRLKTRIQRAEKKYQPTATFESEKEGLSEELDRYENLLNDCADWMHVRTGIPTTRLVDVAISTAFTEGEDRDHIYAELRKLDERGVTAELSEALMSRDQEALMSVKLLGSCDTNPRASTADDATLWDRGATGAADAPSSGSKNLQKCKRLAYRAFQFAESRLERTLEDREAWEYLKEHGIPKDHDDLQDLHSYELPSFETFTTYLSHARRALDDLKYDKGNRRQSKSVVKQSEID